MCQGTSLEDGREASLKILLQFAQVLLRVIDEGKDGANVDYLSKIAELVICGRADAKSKYPPTMV